MPPRQTAAALVRPTFPGTSLSLAAGLLSLAMLLSACGGGGGGGGASGSNATLTVNATSLSFDSEAGDPDPAAQVVSGSLTGVTEPVTVRIEYTNTGVAQAGFTPTSDTAGTLTVSPRSWQQLAPGSYSDTITVRACLDSTCTRQTAGSPQLVRVTTTIRAARPTPSLQLSQRAVALAAVPNGRVLGASLTVADTAVVPAGWTAVSSAGWLQVTPSGSSGAALQITADPAALPEGQHLATVTVTATNAAITQPAVVSVGLYKSSLAGAAVLADPPTSAGGPPSPMAWASHPTQPLLFTAAGNVLFVHHMYTGARTGSLTLPAGTVVRTLVFSDDGTRLYALDAFAHTVSVVDPAGTGLVRQYAVSTSIGTTTATSMAFVRVAGQPVLLFNQGSLSPSATVVSAPALAADDGRVVGSAGTWAGSSYTVLRGTQAPVVYASEQGITGSASLVRLDLAANSSGRVYGSNQSVSGSSTASQVDFAVSPDGRRAVLVYYDETEPRHARHDGTTLAWTPNPDPQTWARYALSGSTIAFMADGRSLLWVAGDGLYRYTASGVREQRWASLPAAWGNQGAAAALRVSSDGLRAVLAHALADLSP